MKKLNLLLISKNKDVFSELGKALAEDEHHRGVHCSLPGQVYEAVATGRIDAVIADEEIEGGAGLEFVRELLRSNPFINCALVSSLYPGEFHEATEGYGVFMQLPLHPGRKEAREISDQLAKIC